LLRTASTVVALAAFWMLLSGFFTPFLLGVGLASVLLVAWLAHRMAVADHEGHPIHVGPAALWYWPWLAKEIVKSGWAVTRVILDPRLPIRPTLVRFAPSQKSEVGLATHANSITLTPGTISVDVGRREFLVHALTAGSAAGVRSGGEMDARVARFEGRR
jgi:multicomponent Na+:H+ antiporter subunit E